MRAGTLYQIRKIGPISKKIPATLTCDMNHVDNQLTRSRRHRARPPRDRGELALYIALPQGLQNSQLPSPWAKSKIQ